MTGRIKASNVAAVPSPAISTDAGLRTGTIKGRVWLGSNPIPRARVLLDRYFPRDEIKYPGEILSDDKGQFSARHVPAGHCRVSRLVEWTSETDAYSTQTGTGSHGVRVEVKPGEVASVDIGGVGRIVVGQLRPAEPDAPGLAYTAGEFRFLTRIEARDVHDPGNHLVLDIESNGRFRVADVPPGDYELYVTAKEATGSVDVRDQASVLRRLNVPRSDTPEPFDLGEVKLSRSHSK